MCFSRFEECKMLVMGMVPSVDELPAPFMSVETSTISIESATEEKPSIPMTSRKGPSLGTTIIFFSTRATTFSLFYIFIFLFYLRDLIS